MSNPGYSKGLSLKKLDLHVHTPASECFRGNATPDDIVQEAISKDLDGIAITDHNSATWVDQVMNSAKGKPLVVFPGVEISCTGGKKLIHIIAIFGASKSSKHIEVLLNKLDIVDPDAYGKSETVTNKSPIEVIELIYDLGGIPILAHANSSNGVLSDMSGQPRTNIIQCQKLLAAEGTDFHDEQKRKNHKRVVDLLDGNDPTYQRRLAVYQASDNLSSDGSGQHCLDGIGNRYSYFKVENLSLEGLRQCFIDPSVRIYQESEVSSINYPRIKRISVNSGFLANQKAEFHDGLTTILGAKGAGKSLLIEFMRFALNQEPRNSSIAQDHLSKIRSKLGEYGTVDITVVDENGVESNISRTFHEIDNSPYDESIPYDPSQIFPVLFLSQNEIIKIAEDESEQLQFIDQFFDFRSYHAKIASLENELERLDKKMADGLRAYKESDEFTSRIATIEQEIKKLDQALSDPIFEKFKQLQEKERIINQQREYLAVAIDSVEKARDSLIARVIPPVPVTLKGDPSLLRINDAIKRASDKLETQFSTLITELKTESDFSKKEYDSWHPQLVSGKKEYEGYLQRIGGDQKAIALNRERLLRDLLDLQHKRDTAATKKEEVPGVSKRREELLDALKEQYDEYSRERQTKCEKFQSDSSGKLRLQILGSSNVEEFRMSLLSLKRGSYLRDDDISFITSRVNPREFVITLLRYEVDKQSKRLQKVATDSGIDLSRMKILADFLLSSIPYEQLLALQYKAIPQDRPEILFNIGDGNYQPLSSVSVGQKCTAMLIMALSDGTMPVIIDQPEDSLDIRSIWDDMCTKLRVGKNHRQFIFTTHNSSLAVASDTDCYLVLEGNASSGTLIHMGSMDHEPLATEVLKYLEGGKGTYELKFAKYGGKGTL
jgi:ABC-type cobalamin/Fe3+-siderophores transport system ATPase subunit